MLKRLNWYLMVSTACVPFAVPSALAQTVSQTVQDENTDAEQVASEDDIVVTGTSIRGIEAAGSQTVGLDRDAIAATGLTSVADVARTLPQLQGLGFGEVRTSAQNGASNTQRGNALNLRGLGPNATLLLVNGHRLAPTGTLSTFTEANVVPVAMLERIEVVADGASAIYGSDAVAGVVNYVLRRSFDGIEMSGRFTGTANYDGYGASIVAGTSWSDLGGLGSGNIMVAYDYDFREPFVQGTNARLRQDVRAFGGLDGRVSGSPISVGNQSLIQVGNTTYSVPAGSTGTGLTAGSLLVNQPSLIDTADYTDYLARTKRHQVVVVANQELGDRFDLEFQGFYTNRESLSRGIVLFPGTQGAVTVTSASPFYISGIPGIAAGTPLQVQYNSFKDIGYQDSIITNENYLATTTLKARLFDGWQAQVSYSYGEDKACGLCYRGDNINLTALNAAVANGTFNPFDTRPASAAAVASFTGDNLQETQNRIHNVVVKADGALFNLPGGTLRAALGGEYLYSWNRYSNGGNAGPTNAFVRQDTILQKRDVKAFFAEAYIPLIGEDMNVPLIQSFIVDAAIRTEEYSDFGRTTNPKVGVIWTVVDGFKLRGSWGTSFRAPSFPNLRGALFRFQNQFIVNNSGLAGIPIDVPATRASKAIVFGGVNPNLKPETAETFSLGFDLQPTALPGLKVSGTYYHVDYRNLIASPGAGATLLASPANAALYAPYIYPIPAPATCVAGNVSTYNPTLQQFLTIPVAAGVPAIQDPCGTRVILDTRLQNIGTTLQDGLDGSIAYAWQSGENRWSVGAAATYILRVKAQPVPNAIALNRVNEINFPVQFRGRANLSWTDGVLGANLFVNHVGGYRNTAPITIAGVLQSESKISAWTTVDLGLTYTMPASTTGALKGVRASVNFQNLFDQDPPIVISTAGGSIDPQNANAFGRIVTFQLTKTF